MGIIAEKSTVSQTEAERFLSRREGSDSIGHAWEKINWAETFMGKRLPAQSPLDWHGGCY